MRIRTTTRTTICLAIVCVSITADRARADGLLQQLRSEVRETRSDSSPPSSSPSPAPRRSNRDDGQYERNRSRSALTFNEDGDSFLGTAIGKVGGYVVTAPFWAPRVGLEGDASGVDAWFLNSPYVQTDAEFASGFNGAMAFSDLPGITKPWFARFQLEYGSNFDGVNHTGLRFQSDFIGRFGIDAEGLFYNEALSVGNDSLQTGDVNLVYRFAHNERWQFRSGLGYNWLNDDTGTDHGVNFTYGVDWYPSDPVFTSATIDLGTLGKTSRAHARAIIGLTRNGLGVYTGYDGLRLGDTKVHSWVTGIEYRY